MSKINSSYDIFANYDLEDKPYPSVILGGDRFLGLFGQPRHLELRNIITTPDYISKIMNACYKNGFRGFDISINKNVIDCFSRLKQKNSDCIGIGNPNWKCGINLNGKDLAFFQDRILATLSENVFSDKQKKDISGLSEFAKNRWFLYDLDCKPFTQKEIDSISVDLKQYQKCLSPLIGLTDFCLIGTSYADWLPLLGREDLIENVINLVRENNFIPLSVHHWTSLVLPKLDKLNFAGHWTYLNKSTQLIDEKDVLSAIDKCKKPITAFKALLSREQFEVSSYFDYLFNKAKINSVVFGVETIGEACLASQKLKEGIKT